ncbi:isocitrate lyase/PEP mutase family protein [Actinotalea subterranea]|uniref:isocitrate lyase/PEP mutase family protein n=1 Tax=Actinotalea subterranea TaxID=2607497 RepID=UPI0011F0988C|nr:isocitrate lyase/phosphoenolpyruvate mutase family protein [Actinotalea subterranea]
MDILDDERYPVPAAPHGATGVAWLRSHVVRFSEGEERRRRRALTTQLLAAVPPEVLRRPGHPVATLAEALGLPRDVTRDVETVAACYHPHTPVTPGSDEAVGRLVAAAGGRWDEVTAARIGLLVQACAATRAAVRGDDPAVPTTRRVTPGGDEVLVDLTGLPFGSGRHACPGVEHAHALVDGARTFARLHAGPEPLLLPNAWDVGSALVLVEAGFAAIGTTSLGVAAAHGLPDGAGATRAETLALARRLARLPVPVSVDVEAGFGGDVAELAAELTTMGVAGINLEDGRDGGLADVGTQAALVEAVKRVAPELFVNARIDTHWLGVDRHDTARRAAAYVEAGADGVFVPGLRDEREIAAQVEALGDVPLNLLSQLPLARLRDLGVRRVSTGSALVRTALTQGVRAATAYRDGQDLPAAMPYDALSGLLDRWSGTEG